MALITKAEARQGIPALLSSDTSQDALLDALIARAEGLAAAWCGYPRDSSGNAPALASATYQDFVRPGVDPRVGYLAMYPIVSITSVKYDPSGEFNGSETTLTANPSNGSDGYRLDGSTLFRLGGGTWRTAQSTTYFDLSAESRGVYRAVYVAGFATAPDGLKSALVALVRWLFDAPAIASVQSAQSPAGASTQNRGTEIPLHVRQMLTPYRRLEADFG